MAIGFMRALKIDFVDEDTPSFCNGHKLSSGKAYFLMDQNGIIRYGGKQCAIQHSTNNLAEIPDLTRSLIARRDGHATGNNSGGSNSQPCNADKAKAIAYVLLRQEKLINHHLYKTPVSYPLLDPYYQEYLNSNDLSDASVIAVLAIEKRSTNFHKNLSLSNLSTCYAYLHILNRTKFYLQQKNQTNGLQYVDSLLNGLENHCSLTQNQINGLHKWLQFLPDDLKEAKLKNFE